MHKSSHTSDKIWAEFISQQEKKIGHKPLGRNLLQFQSFFSSGMADHALRLGPYMRRSSLK